MCGFSSVTATAPIGLARQVCALLLVEPPIDLGDLGDPTLAFAMLHRQDLGVRPVKVKCQIRYLLVEPL
jgi:hypothetical protein